MKSKIIYVPAHIDPICSDVPELVMECHQRGLHLRIILARSEQSYPLASLCDVLPEIVAARDSRPR